MKGTIKTHQKRRGIKSGRISGLIKRTAVFGAAAAFLCSAAWIASTKIPYSSVVYAASGNEKEIPSGISSVIECVDPGSLTRKNIQWIGSSCETVLVGQRTAGDSGRTVPVDINICTQMASTVSGYAMQVQSLAGRPRIMSDKDYDSLLRIVEAEAGIEDLKGKILVANVIMNRVASDYFPDTVFDVIWQNTGGVPQFAPTYDGAIYRVKVSDETREAVREVMNGVDYSEGALFFMARSASEEENVRWFEHDLQWLFKHGYHEFYTIPEDVHADESEEAGLVAFVPAGE